MNTAHRKASRAKRTPPNAGQADPRSLLRVMARIEPLTTAEKTTIELDVLLAFEKLKGGNGTRDHFDALAGALNCTMVLCESIDDPLPTQTAQFALDALMRTLSRQNNLGQWGFDGLALQHIPPAIDLYRQLLSLLTPMQIAQGMRETIQRMEQGHVLNATPPTEATL